MAVDGGAEVVHHVLAHEVREPGLRDAQCAGGDRDGNHSHHEPGQQRRVLMWDRLVYYGTEQERSDHCQAGRDEDERQHRTEAGAVGREQAADAAKVGSVLLGFHHLPIIRCMSRG